MSKPLYIQIKEYIIEQINIGTFKTGNKIYSEKQLKEKFQVSSTTVVKALNELVNEGYLERKQGVGSFVSPPKFTRNPFNLSITEELKNIGIELKTKILSVEELVLPNIANKLSVNETESLSKIERLRYINKDGKQEPLSLMTSYIPTKYLSHENFSLFEKEDSLYKILENVSNLKPYQVKETYSIYLINDKYVANQLKQVYKDPAFFVKRVTYNKEGLPIEYAESYLRWDRYVIEVELYDDK